MAFERAKPVTFRLRKESQDRFEQLHIHRINSGLNANKSDILSVAIDLLFQKELGKKDAK